MGFMKTGISVLCKVPDQHKDETWPRAVSCRPEVRDTVRSVEKTELKIVSIAHCVVQEDRDGQKVHDPYLLLVLE
jgi:hypothetical protein